MPSASSDRGWSRSRAASRRAAADAYRKEIAVLQQVSKVFTPDAEVLLINCSPAATAAGRKFLFDLSEVLIGTNGGTLVASKQDVVLGEVQGILDKLQAFYHAGESTRWGEVFIAGDWVKIGSGRARCRTSRGRNAGVRVPVPRSPRPGH